MRSLLALVQHAFSRAGIAHHPGLRDGTAKRRQIPEGDRPRDRIPARSGRLDGMRFL